ncbi:MAG: leukotriene A4 hydrolase C-terminal domain-containing protein [Bacteroidetes bacterium]|nr:leukotriene A4 hydrolase C-terminal domain-containing protein [Bacteroidota bacterium]
MEKKHWPFNLWRQKPSLLPKIGNSHIIGFIFFVSSAAINASADGTTRQTILFHRRGNSEILCQWLELCIRSNYTAADTSLEKFLTSVGRRKFLKPLYGALIETRPARKKQRPSMPKHARAIIPSLPELLMRCFNRQFAISVHS